MGTAPYLELKQEGGLTFKLSILCTTKAQRCSNSAGHCGLRLRDSVPPTHIKLLRMPIHCNTFYARDRAREIKLTTYWVRDSPK